MIVTGRWVPAWTLAVAAALAVATTHASVVVPMTLDELAREARVIVDARVLSVHVTAEAGRLERVVSLRVLGRWKGEVDEVVHVRLPGGTLGRTRTVVPGAPSMHDDERFVLFLDDAPRGGHRVLGLHQGAWRVQASPRDGSLLVAPAPQQGTAIGGRVARGDGTRRPRGLAEFRGMVDALMEQGR